MTNGSRPPLAGLRCAICAVRAGVLPDTLFHTMNSAWENHPAQWIPETIQ
ncbi:hypothetical protein C4K26_3084 [Pseudomonas chlororaphis]|nr:hypothetical protein C4K26_3084 [Pseudomonas chlororaphis]